MGAFSSQGPVTLFLFTENLNSNKYCEIIESHLFPNVHRVGPRWRFQQDNSPVHTAGVTKQLFEDHRIRVIDWPANSPDLNPIENLWAILKQKVEKKVNIHILKKKKISTSEFQEIIRQEWDDIDRDTFLNLSRSMTNRITELIEKNGEKINY